MAAAHSSPCPLCGQRKGKRPCPGKQGALICSVCCGTKRQVEVQCPADCTYLTGAHAPAYEGREGERRQDLARIAPFLQDLGQDEAAVFFYLLSGMVRLQARHREADDALWQQSMSALRKTLETQESGLVYEHAAEDWRAQALVRDMEEVLRPAENEGRPVAESRVLLPAVKAVVAALEAAAAEGAGRRAFLETAARVTARITAEEPARSRTERRIVEP